MLPGEAQQVQPGRGRDATLVQDASPLVMRTGDVDPRVVGRESGRPYHRVELGSGPELSGQLHTVVGEQPGDHAAFFAECVRRWAIQLGLAADHTHPVTQELEPEPVRDPPVGRPA